MELPIGIADGHDIAIDAQELVTGRTCIIAQSGAGKSWGIAVLCEQLLQMHIGFCIIDTEGEYASLKDQFVLTWIGSDEKCDVDIEQITQPDLVHLLQSAIRSHTAIVFDVSETDMRERVTFLTDTLYSVVNRLRQPFLLIVEEADKFIPQSGESIREIEEISRRGRKRGLGLLIATQRPSLVTKNVLSQCNNQIIGKLSIENDLKSVRIFFPSVKEVNELTELQPGEFFVMGGLTHDKVRMRFHARICEHRGLTPQLSDHPPEPPVSISIVPKPPAPQSPPQGRVISPTMRREDALAVAVSLKKVPIPLIQPHERIASMELVYRPFHHVTARYITGRLWKSVKTVTFAIDGCTGGIIIPHRTGLSVRGDLTELFGLTADEVRVVTTLANGGSTLDEIIKTTHFSPKTIQQILKCLMRKSLVTDVTTMRETVVYAPLLMIEPPTLRRLHIPWTVIPDPGGSPPTGRNLSTKIDGPSIRDVLKGLDPTAEITGFTTFYYPTYSIRYVSGHGERMLDLDGCSGNTLVFPPVLSTAPARVRENNK
jgi:hypothetical protein